MFFCQNRNLNQGKWSISATGKTTLETSGEDLENTLETSGEDVKLHSKRVENIRYWSKTRNAWSFGKHIGSVDDMLLIDKGSMETYSRIGLLRSYGNLQSYWTTMKLWKLTVVLDYYEAMETYSRIGLLRGYRIISG